MTRAVEDVADVSALEPLVAYVRSLIGIRLDGPLRRHLLGTLHRAVAQAGMTRPEEYLDLIRRDAGERERLVDRITVGETHFFRHPRQLAVLSERVIPQLGHQRAADPRLAVWSAGCASGEEAYTLAMLLEDAGRTDVHILATDVSNAALAAAAKGIYRPWSLRGADAQKHRFEKHGELWRVPDRLRNRVEVRHLNLLHDPYPSNVALILCRNVLLYLTDEQVEGVAARLAAALAPGGWLVTATTDPNLDFGGALEPVMTPGGIFYHRSDPTAPRAESVGAHTPAPPERRPERRRTAVSAGATRRSAHRRTSPPPNRPPDVVTASPDVQTALEALDSGDYQAAATVAQAVIASGGDSPTMRAVWARALGNAGRIREAEDVVTAATKIFPLDAELRYLHAELLIEAGSPEGAASAAAAAIYLNPELAVAHLLLGRAEMARGRPDAARRAFATAARMLEALPVDPSKVKRGQQSVDDLARYAATYGHISTEGRQRS